MQIREALLMQGASLQLQRAAADEIAKLDLKVRVLEQEGSTKSNLIVKLEADLAEAKGQLQAKIDRLMLEFCPDEMTPEQKATWASHQRIVEPSAL